MKFSEIFFYFFSILGLSKFYLSFDIFNKKNQRDFQVFFWISIFVLNVEIWKKFTIFKISGLGSDTQFYNSGWWHKIWQRPNAAFWLALCALDFYIFLKKWQKKLKIEIFSFFIFSLFSRPQNELRLSLIWSNYNRWTWIRWLIRSVPKLRDRAHLSRTLDQDGMHFLQ